jgi:antitoxin (DNA-binding transcriptional repressor) of toxin-antitoxin stability system
MKQLTAPTLPATAQQIFADRMTEESVWALVENLLSGFPSSGGRCSFHPRLGRELHLKTGRWVRHAARQGPIVVTDRGRRVAALQPFDASVTGRPLPNREATIRKRSRVPVDSAVYVSELREDR